MTKIDAQRFLRLFLIIDLGVVVFCILQGNPTWLLNSQIAFFSSLAITVGSYFGYKKNIENRVPDEPIEVKNDDIDVIDRIEDPYDLDGDIIEEKEPSQEEIKNIIKEEKVNQSKHTFKNVIFSIGGFASVYRVAGYILLLMGFFYLVKNNIFDVFAYLFGLLIVPIGVLGGSFNKSAEG